MRPISFIAITSSCLLVTAFSYSGLSDNSVEKYSPGSEDQMNEMMYIPNGRGLDLLSLGYRNILSDLLWFNTVNYFGKHYKTDQNYRWLFHMCDLVTTLDPKARHVYEFAAAMLAWEAHQPKASIAILNKATQNIPDYWRFFYLRGFTRMFFLGDKKNAAKDLESASKLPGAPPMFARLAAKLYSDTGSDLSTTIIFLKDMIRNSKDENARRILTDRLNEILVKQGGHGHSE